MTILVLSVVSLAAAGWFFLTLKGNAARQGASDTAKPAASTALMILLASLVIGVIVVVVAATLASDADLFVTVGALLAAVLVATGILVLAVSVFWRD